MRHLIDSLFPLLYKYKEDICFERHWRKILMHSLQNVKYVQGRDKKQSLGMEEYRKKEIYKKRKVK
jgi:hypothetical protein